MESDILFSEQQYWDPWTWVILIGVNVFIIASFIIRKKPVEGRTLYNRFSYVVITIVFIGSIVFLNFRLDTLIKKDGIYVKIFPVHRKYKYYKWTEIKAAYVKEYRPMRDFGGWGVRGKENNKVYSMSGDKGIQIVFTNGAQLLIGTNEPGKAREALDKQRTLTQ